MLRPRDSGGLEFVQNNNGYIHALAAGRSNHRYASNRRNTAVRPRAARRDR